MRLRCHRVEEHLLGIGHEQDWGRGFIPLLPQAAILPRSDAGTDDVKPSDLVLHVVPDVWVTLLKCGLPFVQWRRTCNLV